VTRNATATLWQRRDVLGSGFVAGAGVALCAAAWWIASGDEPFRHQLAMVGVSVIGLVLIFAAQAAWLLRGRAVVGERTRELLGGMRGQPAANGPVVQAPPATTASEFVGGPGLRYYHRPDCAMAAGQGWAPTSRHQHEQDGRTPCRVCRP
jgi:hypothetical protein